jgi:tetratricopeptide (TPR) repeat protein
MSLTSLLGRPAAGAALAVALAATLPFAGTLGHGFALDDSTEVVRNEQIRSLGNVPWMFSAGAWEGAGETAPIYRPLTTLTYALNYAAAGGLDPRGFHLVNVLLHGAVSLLVLALALKVGLPLAASAAGALLFALHPIHVEVVANVAGRKDALAAMFVLLAVLAHAAALRRSDLAWAVVLPPLAFAAALLSKENGVTAFGAFVAWDLLFGREAWSRRRGRLLALYGAYAAVLGLYLWARVAAVGSLGVPLAMIPFLENPLPHVAIAPRLLTAVAVLGKGLALLVLPRTLSPDYSYDAIPLVESPLDPRFLASFAAIAALLWAAARLWRRWPVVTFAVLWYGATVFPTSNLLLPVGTIFGERLLYLPSVGFGLLAGALLGRLLADHRTAVRRVAAGAAAAVAVLLSVRSVAYASVWADEVSLFSEAVGAVPGSAKAHELLGAALMEVGRVPEGVRALEAAVRMVAPLEDPPTQPYVELGVAYERSGRLGDAEGVYAGLLLRKPDFPDALWRLGVVRWGQGRRGEAAELWERTLTVSPGHPQAMNDLGIARYQGGDLAGAEALWLRAARADPRSAGPWLSLGNLYERQGDLRRARAAWREFLERAHYGVYPGERERIAEKLRRTDPASAGSR